MSANPFADVDVTDVQVLGHYRLRLTFADGLRGDVDVSDLADLPGDLVAPLRDPAYFSQVRVDPEQGTIVWPNGVDLAAERLYHEASEHPVAEHASDPMSIWLISHRSVVGSGDEMARLWEPATIHRKQDARRAILRLLRRRLDPAAGTGDFLSESFNRFVESERAPLVIWLSQVAGVPADESSDLVQLALTEAAERWGEPAVRDNAMEWVLGSAVQLLRDPLRELPHGTSVRSRESARPAYADVRVTGALAVAASVTPVPEIPEGLPMAAPVRSEADRALDEALTRLYSSHYPSLVRLTALLTRDPEVSEDVVKDAFVELRVDSKDLLRVESQALAHLRRSVVERSRMIPAASAIKSPGSTPGAVPEQIALFERSAVIAALRTLPVRQREAVVLRFYADLSEAQIADAMGIRPSAVKTQTAKAMYALRAVLGQEI